MEENLKAEIRSIKIVHIALIAGVAFFILITLFMNKFVGPFIGENDIDLDKRSLILLVFNILSIGSIVAGIMVFKKKANTISENQPLSEKLIVFREAMIVRAATIEVPAFLFTVGYMLFGCPTFLFEAVVSSLLLLYFYPSTFRIAREIKHDITELDA